VFNLLLTEQFDERFQDFKITELEFTLFASVLQVPAPEYLQTGLIRKAILILVTSVLKQKLQTFLFILPKKSFLRWDPLGQEWLWIPAAHMDMNNFFPPCEM